MLPVIVSALTIEVVIAALLANGVAAFVRLKRLANPELVTMASWLFIGAAVLSAGLGTKLVGSLLSGLLAIGIYCRATIPGLARWRRARKKR